MNIDPNRMMVVVMAYDDPERDPKALYAMSTRDAAVLCSDPRTTGQGWSTVFAPFVEWQRGGKVSPRLKLKDSALFDELIEELGLTKYAI